MRIAMFLLIFLTLIACALILTGCGDEHEHTRLPTYWANPTITKIDPSNSSRLDQTDTVRVHFNRAPQNLEVGWTSGGATVEHWELRDTVLILRMRVDDNGSIELYLRWVCQQSVVLDYYGRHYRE